MFLQVPGEMGRSIEPGYKPGGGERVPASMLVEFASAALVSSGVLVCFGEEFQISPPAHNPLRLASIRKAGG